MFELSNHKIVFLLVSYSLSSLLYFVGQNRKSKTDIASRAYLRSSTSIGAAGIPPHTQHEPEENTFDFGRNSKTKTDKNGAGDGGVFNNLWNKGCNGSEDDILNNMEQENEEMNHCHDASFYDNEQSQQHNAHFHNHHGPPQQSNQYDAHDQQPEAQSRLAASDFQGQQQETTDHHAGQKDIAVRDVMPDKHLNENYKFVRLNTETGGMQVDLWSNEMMTTRVETNCHAKNCSMQYLK